MIHLEAARPLMIHTDPELLKRVIQNILSNCLRYAEHEILIRMSTDGNSLILLIQDDGPGFLEKDLPHIFERFYKGNGGKNGIGLSIVKAIMDAHNQQYGVKNWENGVEFWFTLDGSNS